MSAVPRPLLMALLALATPGAAYAGAPLRRQADVSRPSLLRLRGGATGSSITCSVRNAARKLCTQPGLVAARDAKSESSILAKHIRGVVFGGMDGILTTFALLAAVAGSKHTSTTLTVVIGISTVLADALSMGAGEYLSAKAEQELLPKSALDDEPGPLEKGLAMFLAFTCFGALPLIGAVLSTALSVAQSESSSFAISIAITASTLFGLGALKSQFGVGVWWQSGAEVAGVGGAAATVAYFTARVVERIVGE